jgi:hypothetical protein
MRLALIIIAIWLAAPPATAADAPPVRLSVKPLLCVVDQAATGCLMSFDIRWKSVLASAYCLNDGVSPKPLHCWASAQAGDLKEQRLVSADFAYWLTAPAGTERLAEVKIAVLRLGSADRRRERRTRHVWDVL